MRKRRYEILLPLKYNDGRPIPNNLFDETTEDIVAQFGGITLQPGTIRGIWVSEGTRYQDEHLRFVVDVDDSPECQEFFVGFKPVLLERFQQVEIYIVSHLIEIV